MTSTGAAWVRAGGVVGGVWRVGEVVDGRYEVVRVHEGGGMGLVYRVRHLEWATDLAVKCPRAELFATAAQREAFIAEAEIWVSLGLHPNVCGCHYVRVLDGIPRVFAEYVAGGSLRDWIDDRRLYAGDPTEALARILHVAVQSAWGLAHAHDRGLVHQDVKPANVLLDVTAEGPVAKVTDFGLARARAVATAPAPADPRAGGADPRAARSVLVSNTGLTPAYASPEQRAGKPVGRRTDIYSFAVSVLEMFTGRISWMSGTAAGAALAARRRLGPEPGIPALPPELADLLDRCLSLDPAARPASMTEVATALVAIHRRVIGTPYPHAAPVAADLLADELNNRGVSLLDLGRPAEAEEAFTAALAADPQHPKATYNAGLLRWRRGEWTDEDVVRALDVTAFGGTDPGEARRLLAEVHEERGDRERADALLGREPAARSTPSSGARGVPWYAPRRRRRVYDAFFGMEVKPSRPSIKVAFTGDGTRAVSVCDGALRVWNVADGRCVRQMAAPTAKHEGITHLGVGGDGRYAVTAGSSYVRFWDLAQGRRLREFDAREGTGRALHWPNSVRLSGDGRVAVVPYFDGTVLVWDVPGGALRMTVEEAEQHATAAVGYDGRLLLTAGRRDGTARLWDIATGRCLRVLDGCERVHDVWLSADMDRAVVAGDGTIRIWDLPTGRVRTLRGVGRLPRVSVSGGFVVSRDVDDTVRLWALDDGRCLRTFRAGGSRVLAAHLDAEAGVLLSAWQDNRLRWWTVPARHTASPRLSKPRRHAELRMLDSRVADLAHRARGAADPRTALELLTEARAVPGYEREPRLLAAWRDLGRSAIRVGLRSAWPTRVFEADGAQFELALSHNGRIAASSGADGTVRVWDVDSGACLRMIGKEPGDGGGGVIGVSHDGSRVMYRSGRRTTGKDRVIGVVTAWSVETGERITALQGPRMLGAAALDPAGRLALLANHDATRLWNLRTGVCERELPPHNPDIGRGVEAVWLGSNLVATAASDQVVRLWDLTTGRCRHTLRGHTSWVMSVCLSPDDRYALTTGGYSDRTIRLWDTATGECLRVFGHEPDQQSGAGPVHEGRAEDARFTPDGRFAVSAGADATVRIWELATGRCLNVLLGHRDEVKAVVVGPDARFALSASEDGTVRRWELDWDLRVP